MANHDILAIGASAGGVEALVFIAKNLPHDFPASIVLTLHLGAGPSILDALLTRAGPLPATFAKSHENIKKGHIYIAPVDRHLIVEGERLLLGAGPRENNARPAIDPMMRSAAACCGSRLIGVVLTGTMSDGASGLWAVGRCGGITIVQDPSDATFPEMPINALNQLLPDHVVKLESLPELLAKLVLQPAGDPMPVPERVRFEVNIAKGGRSSIEDMDRIGKRSGLACPDCHGAMWEIHEDALIRYRCHVGHTYTADLMNLAINDNLRRALGSALRALEERRSLGTRLKDRAQQNGQLHAAATWAQRVEEFETELDVIRDSIGRLDEMAARQEKKIAAE